MLNIYTFKNGNVAIDAQDGSATKGSSRSVCNCQVLLLLEFLARMVEFLLFHLVVLIS